MYGVKGGRNVMNDLGSSKLLDRSIRGSHGSMDCQARDWDKGVKFLKKLWCCVGGSITR